jgi:hypothetical protein
MMLGTSPKSRTGNSRQQLPAIRHYIPAEFKEVPIEMFDPAYMGKLYKLGYQMASKELSLGQSLSRFHNRRVAYGSDIHLVTETLLACARENSKVAKTPDPQALFLNFGDSSLDFKLLAWISDAGNRLTAKSELHYEIDRRFRENGIVIPFPQRDVHLDGGQPLEARLGSDKPAADKNQSSKTLQGEPKD